MTCPDCFHLQQELQRINNERDDILQGIAELRAVMATLQQGRAWQPAPAASPATHIAAIRAMIANVRHETRETQWDSTSTTTNQ